MRFRDSLFFFSCAFSVFRTLFCNGFFIQTQQQQLPIFLSCLPVTFVSCSDTIAAADFLSVMSLVIHAFYSCQLFRHRTQQQQLYISLSCHSVVSSCNFCQSFRHSSSNCLSFCHVSCHLGLLLLSVF